MAYLAFQDLGGAAAVRAGASVPAPAPEANGLTRLEWSVVACARRDGRSTLRPESRWFRLLRTAFGWPNPQLADGRLEALRRMAVLAWRDGYAVAGYEVRAFLAAGFTPAQYELMVDHISVARTLPPRTARFA